MIKPQRLAPLLQAITVGCGNPITDLDFIDKYDTCSASLQVLHSLFDQSLDRPVYYPTIEIDLHAYYVSNIMKEPGTSEADNVKDVVTYSLGGQDQ